MKILVIGLPANLEECRKKFVNDDFSLADRYEEADSLLANQDLIFDFIIDQQPHQFRLYADKTVKAFFNTCNITLAELAHSVSHKMQCTILGFNGLPTMLNRNIFEVSLLNTDDLLALQNICNQLNTEYILVDDRVGLVTPRVIGMIINEAYYTVQEGTASRKDIDLAMKLGTNYPYGPFEWCERIGLNHIYDLLNALYQDTKDERYKICPLMKKEYLGSIKH